MSATRTTRRRARGAPVRGALALAAAVAAVGCFTLRDDDETSGDAGPDAALSDGARDAVADGRAPSDATVPDATVPDANDAGDATTSEPTFDASDADASDGASDGDASGVTHDADLVDAHDAADADRSDGSVLAVPGCVLSGAQPNAPWPMEGYCPSHRHRTPYRGPHDPKTVHPTWTQAMATDCESGVSIGADGTLYAAARNGLYAFASGGKPRWVFPLTSGTSSDEPGIGVDGTLYLGDGNGNVFAIAPDGGQIGSPGSLGEGTRTGPTLAGNGDLLFSLSTQEVVALAPSGWLVDWTATALGSGSPDMSRPSVSAEGWTIFGTSTPNVEAVVNGKPRWVDAFDAAAGPAPSFALFGTAPVISPDGAFVVVAQRGPAVVYELDVASNQLKWSWPTGSEEMLGLSMDDEGRVYVTAQDGVVAIGSDGDAGTGTRFLPQPNCTWALIDADGWLYVACGGTGVFGIDPTLTTRWSIPLETNQSWLPADGLSMDADGTLYLVLDSIADDAGPDHAEVKAIAP